MAAVIREPRQNGMAPGSLNGTTLRGNRLMGRAVVTDNPFLARRTNGTVTLPSLSSSAEGSEFIRDRFDKMFGQLGTVVVSCFFFFL